MLLAGDDGSCTFADAFDAVGDPINDGGGTLEETEGGKRTPPGLCEFSFGGETTFGVGGICDGDDWNDESGVDDATGTADSGRVARGVEGGDGIVEGVA